MDGRKVKLPLSPTSRSGGSLTSWDDKLIALAQDGKIYIINSDHSVEPAKIQTPDQGYDAYVRVSKQAPYNEYTHNFRYLRYNDITRFETGQSGGLLISYTTFDESRKCYRSVVARLALNTFDANVVASGDDWEILFQSNPCLPLKDTWRAIEGHMAGGRMVFDGEHTAYVTVGDYHWDGMYGPASVPGSDLPTAQDPNSDYGRVVAIDLNSGDVSHMSLGQRNMQGITIDESGDIWTVEHGIRGGDELNRIERGTNYGWPYETYGTLYSSLPVPNTRSLGRHDAFTKPAISWLPSIATSGLTTIKGFHEAWDGDLLASGFRQHLARIRISDQRVVFTEFINVGERVRYVHQHTNGEIVLYTDEATIIFIKPREGGLGQNFVGNYIRRSNMSDEKKIKLGTALGACMECHSLNRGENGGAPSLADVFKARIGSSDFQNYSNAMESESRIWTRALLADYIRDPQSVVPGTIMPETNISDDETIDALVDMLIALNERVE